MTYDCGLRTTDCGLRIRHRHPEVVRSPQSAVG
jgi:hypothetical protein